MPEKKKTASILPSSFTDDAGLLDMSMEEAVQSVMEQEKKRQRMGKDDDNQQEVVISAKVTPMGLVAVLNLFSNEFSISRSMLSRCMSHHLIAWYDGLPGLNALTASFYTAYGQAVSTGNPDLCENLRNKSYKYTSSLVGSPTTMRSIVWVLNKLNNISLPLGLSPTLLFHVGLCWSMSRSENKLCKGTVDRYLVGEATKMEKYVGERLIHISSLSDMIQYRNTKS